MAGTYNLDVASELGDRIRESFDGEDVKAVERAIERLLAQRGIRVPDVWAAFAGMILRTVHRIEPQVVKRRMLEVSRKMRATQMENA